MTSRAAAGDDTAPIVDRLWAYSREFTAAADAALGTEYIENGQILALGALAKRREANVADLATIASLERRQLMEFLQVLASRGILELGQAKTDRRRRIARITPRGTRELAKAEASLAAFFESSAPLALEIAELTADPSATRSVGSDAAGGAADAFDLALLFAEVGMEIGRSVRSTLGEGGWQSVRGRRGPALDAILRHPVCRPVTLAAELGLSPAGTTYLIDALITDGLVERTRDIPNDRRGVRIVVTDAGRQAAGAFGVACAQNTRLIHDRFSTIYAEASAAA